MSERFNIDTITTYQQSRELLGEKRLDPLSAFSTEEHLQRVLDAFRNNPDVAINYSSIGGGTSVIKDHRSTLEAQLPETVTDRMPRISALHNFFRLGYGLVECAVVGHPIYQADSSQIASAYKVWSEQPQQERTQEIKAYLSAQDADMLAMNLLEGEEEGTILNYAKGINISIPRVTGEPSYTVHASQDLEARSQMTEGVLAAIYLLREHHIGQSMSDANTFFEPTIDTVRPPETPPPGYYLG